MSPTSPKSSRPARGSLRLTLPQAIAATAVVAVLCAGYRAEVNGHRGLGLVPACMVLVSCAWFRHALAARKARGMATDLSTLIGLAILSMPVGAGIIALSNAAFLFTAGLIDVSDPLRWRLSLGDGEALFRLLFPAALPLALTLLLANRMRRRAWKFAESLADPPAAPDRDESPRDQSEEENVPVGP